MFTRSITAALLIGASALTQAGELSLFAGPSFSGGEMRFNTPVNDLSRIGFNDRAASLVVHSGRWQVCEHANFEGECVYLDRGDYADLRRLGRRVSSLREVDDRRQGWDRERRDERGGDRRHGWEQGAYEDDGRDGSNGRYGRYRGPAIEMYRKSEFRSDRLDLNDPVLRNFSAIGFNDRAQSLVVRYGQWEFCEHADFRGNCEVYGPGRYPHLGNLSSRMSSVRRVR